MSNVVLDFVTQFYDYGNGSLVLVEFQSRNVPSLTSTTLNSPTSASAPNNICLMINFWLLRFSSSSVGGTSHFTFGSDPVNVTAEILKKCYICSGCLGY